MQSPRVASLDGGLECRARGIAGHAGAAQCRDRENPAEHRHEPGAGSAAVRYGGLSARSSARRRPATPANTFSDLPRPTFFFPGPSGYDAEFVAAAGEFRRARPHLRKARRRADYRLDAALRARSAPALSEGVAGAGARGRLSRHSPRASRRDACVTPSRASACLMSYRSDALTAPTSAHRLSCRDADKVAVRFLKALNVAGGAPPAPANADGRADDRPAATRCRRTSPITRRAIFFPAPACKGQGGRADPTVYAKIRFPMAQAPAYVNSQSFMNWGDCNLTGRVRLPRQRQDRSLSLPGQFNSAGRRRVRRITPIRGAIISASIAITTSANVRRGSATRAKTSGRARA